MKQKSFIKPTSTADYIKLGLKKADSAIKMLFVYLDDDKKIEPVEMFDVLSRHKHYLSFASKGKMEKAYEDLLVDWYFNRYRGVQTNSMDSIEAGYGLRHSLILLCELAGYYSAMAKAFHKQGDMDDATHYVIKLAEINGMLYRLHAEKIYLKIETIKESVVTEVKVETDIKKARAKKAIDNANIRLEKSKAKKIRKDWDFILECYDDWMSGKAKTKYKSLAQFIRDMEAKSDLAKPTTQVLKRKLKERQEML